MKVEGSHFPLPASPEEVDDVRRSLPSETPAVYFDFLLRSDGGEIWFDEESPEGFDCLRFYSAAEMLNGETRRCLDELMPTLLTIGGDQGSQFLAYDKTFDPPWPIVMYLPGWGSEHVASTLTELANRYLRSVGETVPPKVEHGGAENDYPASPPDDQ